MTYKDIKIVANEIIFPQICEMLADGISVKIPVKGNSMLPFFKNGQAIVILPIKDENIKVRNVVLGKNPANTHYVVHRIIKIDGNTVTLMGDGNAQGVEIMSRNNIFGYIYCSPWQKKMATLWYHLRPVRRYLLAIYRLFTTGRLHTKRDF